MSVPFTKTEKILYSNLSNNQKWKKINERTRYYTENRRDKRMKDKLHIANNMMNQLNIQGNTRKEVEYMITSEFTNFKDLIKNCNNEQIIALMIFYCMKSKNIRIQIEKYKIFTELNLTSKHYMTFATRLINYYKNKIPINIKQ